MNYDSTIGRSYGRHQFVPHLLSLFEGGTGHGACVLRSKYEEETKNTKRTFFRGIDPLGKTRFLSFTGMTRGDRSLSPGRLCCRAFPRGGSMGQVYIEPPLGPHLSQSLPCGEREGGAKKRRRSSSDRRLFACLRFSL